MRVPPAGFPRPSTGYSPSPPIYYTKKPCPKYAFAFAPHPPEPPMWGWCAPPSSTGPTPATPGGNSSSASKTPTPPATPRNPTKPSSTPSPGSAWTGTRAWKKAARTPPTGNRSAWTSTPTCWKNSNKADSSTPHTPPPKKSKPGTKRPAATPNSATTITTATSPRRK